MQYKIHEILITGMNFILFFFSSVQPFNAIFNFIFFALKINIKIIFRGFFVQTMDYFQQKEKKKDTQSV